MLLGETLFNFIEIRRLKVKIWKKIFHANGKKMKGVAILLSDKIDFETKAIKRDREGPSNSTSGIYLKKLKHYFERHTHSYFYCSIIYSSQDMEAT